MPDCVTVRSAALDKALYVARFSRVRMLPARRVCFAMTWVLLFLVARAAGRGEVNPLSEVQLSVSGMRGSKPRLTALAATLVAPLGSPLLRGVQRTLPLVAFLGSGASRCRWQMKAQRLIRSRASGGCREAGPPEALRQGGRTVSFRERKEMGLDLRSPVTANTQRLNQKRKKPRAAFAARGFLGYGELSRCSRTLRRSPPRGPWCTGRPPRSGCWRPRRRAAARRC